MDGSFNYQTFSSSPMHKKCIFWHVYLIIKYGQIPHWWNTCAGHGKDETS